MPIRRLDGSRDTFGKQDQLRATRIGAIVALLLPVVPSPKSHEMTTSRGVEFIASPLNQGNL